MTTWFAQNSSVNIDSVNQWNSAANGSGSWLTWASLAVGDVLVANGKTSITINQNFTCASVTNAANGGTAGGNFTVATTRTLVCSVVANNGNVINLSGSGTLSVTGSMSGGSTNNARAIEASGTCACNVVGDVTNGSGSNCQAIVWGSTGILSITGNCYGGSISSYEAVRNNSTGTVIITGNCIGATGNAVSNASTGTVTITGNCTGGSGNNAYGVQNSSTGTVTVNGNCTGGSGSASYGAYNATTGTMRVLGVAIGNDHGLGYSTNNGAPGVFGFGINSGANQATTSVRGIQYGAKGQSPTAGLVQLEVGYLTGSYAKFVGEPTSFTQYTFGPQEYLGGQPSEANVRLGTTYNFGLRTGTLAVPSPTLVAIGVATDNTVGSYAPSGATAADVADAVWDEDRSAHTTSGTFGATSQWVSSGDTSGITELLTRIPDAAPGAEGGLPVLSADLTVLAELDSADKAALVDLIWDEATSGHTTAGTYGGRIVRATNSNTEVQITGSNHIAADVHEFQTGVITAGDFAANAITASALATDAVTEIQSGLALAATALSTTQWTNTLATDLGTTNTTVATNLNATVSSRSTQTSVDTIDDLLDTEMPALTAAVAAEAVKTSAIKAKTDNLPTDPADQSLVEAAITAATSPLATPAQVNAEVVDVLSVDTFAELSAPPAATSSLKDKLTWLFMYARNKVTQTATTRTLYRDDTTTVAGTSGTSDNGTTFTKGEDA